MARNNNGLYKRPVWQWVIFYLVIAVILYGLIYYIFVNKNTETVYNNTVIVSPNPAETPTAGAVINTPDNTLEPTPINSTVSIENFNFTPNVLTIKKGVAVTWVNNDSVAHTVTGNNGGPTSNSISPGQSYQYMFSKVGTFTYHCSIHPSMHGSVVVTL